MIFGRVRIIGLAAAAATVALGYGALRLHDVAWRSGYDAAQVAHVADMAQAAERVRDLRSTIRDLERTREEELAEIRARFASAQSSFEQEVARYEADRLASGRGCTLDGADLDWLRSLGTAAPDTPDD